MCHALIIEDEPMIAMLLQDAFEEAGATTFSFAATEDDAVALALQIPPDVIASDVILLQGTGPIAVQRIQAALGEVPVVFLTATPNACRPCSPPGVVLVKPATAHEIKRAFQQVWHG